MIILFKMIIYRSFEDGLIHAAHDYQCIAFNHAESRDILTYDHGGHTFTLRKCEKFDHTYTLIRDDSSLSGIISSNQTIEVKSTHASINTAIIGSVLDSRYNKTREGIISGKNYCVEYSGGIVEIMDDDIIWMESGKIMIGWHGSYSPPHGQ